VPKAAQDDVTEGTPVATNAEDQLVREGDIAGDYLERLLDLLDYDGDIDLDVEAGRAVVSIDGGEDLVKLVGDRGSVLEALQELTRLAVQQSSGNRSRLMLDIAGWRQARRAELTDLGTRTARSVLESGESAKLRPMTPFERKVVHDAGPRGLQRERGRGTAASGRHLPRCLTSPNPCSASGCRSPAGLPSTWSARGSSAACSGRGKRRGCGIDTC
jgi:spoIIIJ-associated protein